MKEFIINEIQEIIDYADSQTNFGDNILSKFTKEQLLDCITEMQLQMENLIETIEDM